jgi:hypothetical protein
MKNKDIVDQIEQLLSAMDKTNDKVVIVSGIKEIVHLFRQLQFPADKQIELAACTVAFIDPLKDYLQDRTNDQPFENSRGFVQVGFYALAGTVQAFSQVN